VALPVMGERNIFVVNSSNMKKVFLLWMIVSGHSSFSQYYFPGYTWSSDGRATEKTPSLIIATRTTDADFFPETSQLLSVADPYVESAAFLAHRPGHLRWVASYDTSRALFFVHGIDRKTAAEYEFRVLLNGRDVVAPWSNIVQFTQEDPPLSDDYSGKTVMGYLGGYGAPMNNYLVVDLRRKGSDSIIAYTIVGWKTVHPVLLNIYTADELNEFLKKLSRPHGLVLDNAEIEKWKKRYPANQLDSLTRLPKKLLLPSGQNNLVFYLRVRINRKEQLEYQLIRDGTIYTDWKANDFDNPFIWLKDLPPGDYQLNMRFPIQRQRVTGYPFEIAKAWTQTTMFKLLAGSLIAAFFGFIFLLFRGWRQKRMFLLEKQKKEKAETEMRAIRAQLNPHFVFNALSSIQGLINKSELDGANRYLSDFAGLMREVLEGNYRPMNVLDHEIRTLESYLRLEQLRFHFSYAIQVEERIAAEEVQLPTLLLQPLVENAVKHGVSGLQEKGRIEVGFRRSGKDLGVWIMDNGRGFDGGGGIARPPGASAEGSGARRWTAEGEAGYGLKLTRERIALLNEAYGESAIVMEIRSDGGTWVHLTFKNWLV
jgi:two-component system LytT family sensor kinase